MMAAADSASGSGKRKWRGRKKSDKKKQHKQEGGAGQKQRAALRECLAILTSWEDAADAELVTALLQLASCVEQLREALGADPLEDGAILEHLLGAIETCCAHTTPSVRVAAWEAVRDLSLQEGALCEPAVERGLVGLAFSQLGAAAEGGDAAGSAELRLRLLGVLWNLCEACPEALGGIGAAEMGVLSAQARGGDEAALAALQLLLVVTDDQHATSRLLLEAPGWRDHALEVLRSAPPADGAPAPPDASSQAAWHAAVMTAALALNLAPLAAADEAEWSLVDAALPLLGAAACAPATQAVPAAARQLALEVLCNTFSYGDGEEGDEGEGGEEEEGADDEEEGGGAGRAAGGGGELALRSRAAAALPVSALLPPPRGLLARLEEDMRGAALGEEGGALAARCAQCVGTLLAGCAAADLAATAPAAWEAVVRAGQGLGDAPAAAQDELLGLAGCLAARCAAEGAPLPASQRKAVAAAACGWPQAVGPAAQPAAVALLGPVLLMARAEPAAAEAAAEAEAQLERWLRAPALPAAAEAFAALAEAGGAAEARRAALPALREKAARVREASERARLLELLE